jgi:hypothetical protein
LYGAFVWARRALIHQNRRFPARAVTKSGAKESPGAITHEFVTSGYFGGLAGDPDGGKTRVVTQNGGGGPDRGPGGYATPGPSYWVGKQQAPGGQFEAYWDKVGAVGHYDYGSLTMARTLGSDSNQVAKNGRRVLLGWIGGTPASQSLARDLTLSADYELLQQFVPELQVLRLPASLETATIAEDDNETGTVSHSRAGSLQLELVATFSWTTAPTAPFGVTVLGGTSNMSIDCAGTDPSAPNGCMVGVDGKWGPLMPIGTKSVSLHAIVDHESKPLPLHRTHAKPRNAMASKQQQLRCVLLPPPAHVEASASLCRLACSCREHLQQQDRHGDLSGPPGAFKRP